MSESRSVLVPSVAFGLSFALPAEDIPKTPYDKSEALPSESTPLYSIDALPESARLSRLAATFGFSLHRRFLTRSDEIPAAQSGWNGHRIPSPIPSPSSITLFAAGNPRTLNCLASPKSTSDHGLHTSEASAQQPHSQTLGLVLLFRRQAADRPP
jgi:hypothetical protein